MKKILRSIFRLRPMEALLVYALGKFPGKILRGFASQNYMYPHESYRTCTRHGIRYKLDINDYQNWLIYFYSESDSSFGLLGYVQKNNVVFDVGGNIGQTALMLAQKITGGGCVYSFEPFPDTLKKFQCNLSLNPALAKVIQLQNMALGAAADTLHMYQDCNTNSGANRMLPADTISENTVQVPVTTIDEFTAQHSIIKIDLIKIDVEGFEMNVLKGAINTLIKLKPALFIELDDNNLRRQGSSAEALCTYLQSMGYAIYEEQNAFIFNVQAMTAAVNIYCTQKRPA